MSTATRNTLSLRLVKILGSTYDDNTTREALEILSTLYIPPSSRSKDATTTKRKSRQARVEETVDGALSDESGDEVAPAVNPVPSVVSALDEEQALIEGAAKARKNLKKDMENKLSQTSKMFLAAFAEVNQNLDTLQEQVAIMQVQCDTAQAHLQATNTACRHLLERADVLRQQRQTTTAKQAAIVSFLSRFTLTEEEEEIISSADFKVGPKLFAVIDRCEKIKSDCFTLSTIEDGETRVGADIKQLIDQKLETGYEKIFLWTKEEFRQLARDIHAEPSPALRESVRRLRERPALFSEALGALSLIRQNSLLASFLAALTKGGPGGYPRPIELHAHEPTRYVGDMLAWIHQATAGEREFLDGIFEVSSDGRMVGSVRVFNQEEISEEEGYIRELLDSNLEKLSPPLKTRVQQTIKSQEGSVTSYKIANLLQFYQTTMKRTIGEEALISQTLKEITETSLNVFFDTVRAHGRSLLRFLHPLEADLAPPMALRESCMILREIMQVYDSSLIEDETPQQRQEGFRDVLDSMVKPMLDMCTTMSNLMKKPAAKGPDMSAWDRAVFMINCLVYIESVLQPFEFTENKRKELETLMDDNVQIIVEAHVDALLEESGIGTLVATLDDTGREMPLSRVPNCASQDVSTALHTFDTFLSNLDVSSSPHLSLLTLPRLGTLIHRTALERVARAYGRLCVAIRDPKNKYEFAGTLLGGRRPFGQMSTLYQVLGLDQVDEQDAE
ncbi:hypothetical protein PIIN_05038 [Serendipita indica DSM 11827]|uniref:Conserved oligomeric Golgi complex subunit 6 n=1 Tax=Serendipita indica (strain DSM 11827) TaxID=1109443 RepID=G4TIG0_SERID|nr:hypothetical protein PIIN_05038 [Serendipita indica DSM 11827]